MRYPDAIWRPTGKHGYGGFDSHSQEGAVVHSMEGSLQAGFGVLDGTRQASWHFSIPQAGAPIYQHVDTDHIAWTNGSREANTKFWGIECEGGGPGYEGEPLTEPQFAALLDLLRWLWATHGVSATVRQETLWEHREMTRFGSAATSCPSGRIPWARLINEWEDEMLDETADYITFERMFQKAWRKSLVKVLDKDRKEVGDAHPPGRWAGVGSETRTALNTHTGDASKHSGQGGYTDADAVKAVKDKL